PGAPQMFGNAGREHMEKYGTTAEQFAKIGWKNHKHSVNNPYSQFQDEYSLRDVMKALVVYEPLTKLHCCPTPDGPAAAIGARQAGRARTSCGSTGSSRAPSRSRARPWSPTSTAPSTRRA